MSPSSKAWRICDVNKRPGAREESFRLTTEKMVSFFARGPYCFRGKPGAFGYGSLLGGGRGEGSPG